MRRYLVFVSAALGLLMYSIDATAVAVAFPNFIKEFHAPVMWAAWTISIYYIAMTMSMPLAGNLSDSFGRKRIFLASLALFTGSSLLCGLAPNIYALIGFRFLQGIGGAAFLPTASGIVSEHFPENRERMIGLFTSIFPIGGIIGPNLGGWIVSTFSWRYIFYINLPIGLVLIGMILMLLHSSKIVSRPHVDLAGVFSMSGGILFLMFGLNLVGESFERHPLLVPCLFLAMSLASLSLFFRHEKRVTNPIMDLTLLKSTPFLAANTLNLVIGAGVFGVFAFLPYYATSVHRLSTLASGVILTPRSLGTIPASATCAFLLKRVGYRRPIIGGLLLTACALFLFAPGHLWSLMGGYFSTAAILSFLILLSGIGLGVALPAANNACIELMPQKVGTIVGLRGMFRTVGGAVGVSLLTLILHVSGDPAKGFRLVFTLSAIAIFCAIPLVFLMPAGRRGWSGEQP
jgi:EmrB/QacA subfamily drug resistance transporter